MAASHESDAEIARRSVEQGQKCVDQGHFASAYRAFDLAYSKEKNAAHLWKLALIETQAGYPGTALRHLREYVTDKGATKENIKRAAMLKDRLKSLVGRLHVVAPPGTNIDAFGAVGTSPLVDYVPLDPDELYFVRATGPKMPSDQRKLTVAAANEDVYITFPLPPPAQDTATVAAPPGR